MKQKFFRNLVSLIALSLVLVSALAITTPALATADATAPFWANNSASEVANLGLSNNKTPVDITIQIVRLVIGFLGLIAVIIILIGGFKWMTAGGSEDKIGEARKLIIAGIVGLVIIIASFAIASFVINQMVTATS